jgi:hypothetical protein
VTEFARALDTLEIEQRSAARWFGTSERNIRRWKSGTRKTPPGVMVTIRLMMAGKVGPADVELAATSISSWTNGDAEPKPPAPLEEAPAPAQAVLARIEAATLADPGFTTTAMTIYALGPKSCRWPHGDPGRPGFGFCGELVVAAGSYCPKHCRTAYIARRELIGPPPSLGSPAPGEHSRQPKASAARRMLRAAH